MLYVCGIMCLLNTVKHTTKGKSMNNQFNNNKPVCLVDCDQVITNFNQKVADVFEELFGHQPEIVNPRDFKAATVYDFSGLNPIQLMKFKEKTNDEKFWSNMKATKDAIWFINKLAENFNVVVLTSMNEKYQAGREENLKNLGMNISKVIAVSTQKGIVNPKEKIAKDMNAVFFLDDLKKNFIGLSEIDTKLIYLDHEYTDRPDEKYGEIYSDHVVKSLKQAFDLIMEKFV